jgi:predicted O-methyltransferase YrrM
MKSITTVPVEFLHDALDLSVPVSLPAAWLGVPLPDWKMDADDAILRQVFRQFRPMRHLEFGTLVGDGVLRVVEECDATVWTINLLEGETKPSGQWAYGTEEDEVSAGASWRQEIRSDTKVWVRNDAFGMVGRKYLQAGWGKRVCQIYADSREWDTRAYPSGFFDTCLIDGGHTADIVANDAAIAMRLVRPGGLVMWHDFCPNPEVMAACDSTQGVFSYITTQASELERHFEKLFWVTPSWLLFGVRRAESR